MTESNPATFAPPASRALTRWVCRAPEPVMDLTLERKNTLADTRKILYSAKAANRDLTSGEQATVEADMERVKELDPQIKDRQLVTAVMSSERGQFYADNPEGSGLFSESAKCSHLHARHRGRHRLGRVRQRRGGLPTRPGHRRDWRQHLRLADQPARVAGGG
jgi:hypothetical protein